MPSPALAACLRKVDTGDDWLEQSTVGHAVETLLRREVAARAQAQDLTPRPVEGGPLEAADLPPQVSATQGQKPGCAHGESCSRSPTLEKTRPFA